MTISVIVAIPATPLLHPRHLLTSLKNQSQDIEVLLYHDSSVTLPPDIPEHWHIHACPQLKVGYAWNNGLAEATGTHICFTSADVYYHPRHFESLQFALERQTTRGLYHLPRFVTPMLYEQPSHPICTIQASDWLGHILWEDLPIPIGAILFERQSLAHTRFSEVNQYYVEDLFIAQWLAQHELVGVNLPTVTSLPGRSRPVDVPAQMDELLHLFRHWCQEYPLTALMPSWAKPLDTEQQATGAHHWLLQVLYNRGLTTEAQNYRVAHAQAWPLFRECVLWVATDMTSIPPTLYQWAKANQQQPVLLVLEPRPQPHKANFCVQFTQAQGMPVIALSNAWPIPAHPNTDCLFPEMLPLFREMLQRYQPDLVHFISLQGYSLQMAQWTAEQNIPLLCSWQDPWWLCARGDLKLNGSESCVGPLVSGVNCKSCHNAPRAKQEQYAERTRMAHHILRQLAAKILLHDAMSAAVLLQNGISADQLQRIQSPQDLAEAYATVRLSSSHRSQISPHSLFHNLIPHMGADEYHQSWVAYFRGCHQVLDYGAGQGTLLKLLHQADIPAIGYESDAWQREAILSQGLPVHAHTLGRFLRQFDGLHAAFQLEQMSPDNLLKWLQHASLAVCSGGKMLLRLVDPNTTEWQQEFWNQENHIRPWPVALLIPLLSHFHWAALETGEIQGPWPDVYLLAQRQNDTVSLTAPPIATTRFTEFWAQQLTEAPPGQKVLLIGQQVVPQWQLWRLECEQLQAISLDLSEVIKVASTAHHALRYSSQLTKTLSGLSHTYDSIVLQAVVETLYPDELLQLLLQCRDKLTDTGTLLIQTIAVDSQGQVPAIFWESLYNLRPYSDLQSLLQQAGWQVEQSLTLDGVQNWYCQASELPVDEHQDTVALSEALAQVMQQAPNAQVISHLEELTALQTHPCDMLYLPHGLDYNHPEDRHILGERVQQALQPGGYLLLTGWNIELAWAHSPLYRPWPLAVVNQWLQAQGFCSQELQQTAQGWSWMGRKLLNPVVSPPLVTPLKLLWEGDIFEYHSLSLVNREILAQLATQPTLDIEICTYNPDKYLPSDQFKSLQQLQTHSRRPLLAAPDVVVRHHWPPDFTPPAAGHWVMIQPWEFGAVPERWIYHMNKYLDELWVPSSFVKRTYEESGLLPEKVFVVPNGVDSHHYHPQATPLPLKTTQTFKFLFVGGAIFRKGIDILLKAFIDEFSAAESVCLVIKEFGGGRVYNNLQIPDLLRQAREEKPDLPEVLHLTDDIPLEQMPGLYTACDALVHPYRGEGFGFPIAEAMACERPVIVTGAGACLDFCHGDNAYLIPAERQIFDENKVDGMPTSSTPYWEVPSYAALRELMRHVFEHPAEASIKARAARETIVSQFSWEHVAAIVNERLQSLQTQPIFRFNRERLLSQALGKSIQAMYQGQPSEAVKGFEYALKVDPYQPAVRYNLGMSYLQQGDYEQALSHLSQSLREGDCTADLCYAMAITLERLGDIDTAQHFYIKSQELNTPVSG